VERNPISAFFLEGADAGVGEEGTCLTKKCEWPWELEALGRLVLWSLVEF